jgi:hypothetical protein
VRSERQSRRIIAIAKRNDGFLLGKLRRALSSARNRSAAIVGALVKNRPRPRKTFQQTMLRGSIVMLSVGNPSAAGTQRRQALHECPVMLACPTARGINRKWWSVAAMLDTAAFLTWRDCPWLVRQWCVAAMAIVKVFAGATRRGAN